MIVLIASMLITATFGILYVLRQNINLFYTPEALLSARSLSKSDIRLGGMVVAGSVKHHDEDLSVSFDLTDYKQTIFVKFKGILPDLFREGQGIVAKGHLNSRGVFIASQVLAKHDANYMPKELRASLKKPLQKVS